ncbi:hypothetical protein HDF16_004695 [Granulicella aggregans]|uniref:Uncharacterized protein n=1 Tax=Granulicella aggregans TaxID=474949 RepID=A0A7W7ZHM7_9BACT|nr:hypothetical protein [Granulicella aggregans]
MLMRPRLLKNETFGGSSEAVRRPMIEGLDTPDENGLLYDDIDR